MAVFQTLLVLSLTFMDSVNGYTYDVTVNLKHGDVFPSGDLPVGVEWHEPLIVKKYSGYQWKFDAAKSKSKCKRQGVLKLTLSPEERKCVDIHMWFENSTATSFHIADASSNRAYMGNSRSSNDAEVYADHKNFYMYRRETPRPLAIGDVGYAGGKQDFLYGFVEMMVGNQKFKADNGTSVFSLQSPWLFTLNGQPDSNGDVDYDIYVGLNRAIDVSFSRYGTGLCWVGISFRNKKCGRRWLDDDSPKVTTERPTERMPERTTQHTTMPTTFPFDSVT